MDQIPGAGRPGGSSARPAVLMLGLGEPEAEAVERLVGDELRVVRAESCGEVASAARGTEVAVAILDGRLVDLESLRRCLGGHAGSGVAADPVRIVLCDAEDLNRLAGETRPHELFRCLVRPWTELDLRLTIRSGVEHWRLRKAVAGQGEAAGRPSAPAVPPPPALPRTPFGFIGKSPALRRSLALLRRLMETDCPVLIRGETGVGKDLFARALHEGGCRARGPFARENCAALTRELLASELFGHRRGAFTGAIEDRPGLFEAAHGGTLFLDEIGDCPLDLQSRLLRVVESGEVRRVGENRVRQVDVRLVTATHRDLERAVREGTFRQDLFYRIAVVVLDVPPLRERREDIPHLARHFLRELRSRHDKQVGDFDAGAMEALMAYDYPGNVRELRNEVARAYSLADPGRPLTADLFSPHVRGERFVVREVSAPLREMIESHEARLIENALAAHGGNQTQTAAALGISRRTLVDKISRYGLRSRGGRRDPISGRSDL